MSKKNEEKAVAKAASNEMMIPDYINMGDNRGSEDVGMDDITIPRIDLLQALSPAVNKKDPAYIEGAEPGMLINSVTKKLYPEFVVFVPVMFKKEWIIWKNRKQGGGFRGAFPTMEEAEKALEAIQEAEPGMLFDINDTAQQIVLVIDEEGVNEAVISMSKTKLKTSRQLNSLIRLNKGPRFSRCYFLSSIQETNSANEDYFNFAVGNNSETPFPSREIYEQANKLYEDICGGVRITKFDTDFEENIPSKDDDIPY